MAAQDPPPQKKTPAAPQAKPTEEDPPEEDESLIPKEYALNPLEATRNITTGNFYLKKGNVRAAARRYLEATKWDPGSAEAFLKLGEADERLHDREGAREAYTKYLEISPDAKNAPELKKKMEKWPSSSGSAKK
jgi:tetratricopeptide (TPR) repeat protein